MGTGTKPSFASTTVGLAVGVTAAVVLACAGGAYLYSKHHMRSLLETARATALAEGDLIRVALEHQMIENDRTLIANMMESFRKQNRVERLVLLDRAGAERELRVPPDQAGSSRVIEARRRGAAHGRADPQSGGVLRLPRLEPQDQRCTDSGLPHGGIGPGDGARPALDGGRNGGNHAAAGGSIGVVIRVAVLRRLQRFETAARQIAAGDLGRRVPAEGSDTLSWLAREFNTMADSVTGLVGEVRNQRERLETVINSIDDGIVVLDAGRTSSPPTMLSCAAWSIRASRCWAVRAAS